VGFARNGVPVWLVPVLTQVWAIDDVPLPDLLQLFSSSRKTGTLVIKTDSDIGKVYLDKGQIIFAEVNDGSVLPPDRAVYRILAWQHGAFYMEPVEEHAAISNPIAMSAEAALMEGLRIYDEVMRHGLPAMRSAINVPNPLTAALRDLSPEQLDVFQVAMFQGQLEAVFNNCPLDDQLIAQQLVGLINNGYLTVTEPGNTA